jgi:pimeloyl-ACP methyl ester carboxylesterase
MIPGLGLTGRFYEPNATAFAAAGFRFVVPDLPGMGGTSGARTGITIAETSAFVVAFLDMLGLTRVHLIGHSVGAQAALHTAAHAPARVRALVLVGPTGADRARRARLRHQAVGLVREALHAPWPVIGAVARDYVRTSPLAYVGTWVRGARDEPCAAAPRVTCPALLMVGTRDPVAERRFVAQLAAHLPNAQIAWLEAGGHALPRDSAAGFNAAAITFLRTCN